MQSPFSKKTRSFRISFYAVSISWQYLCKNCCEKDLLIAKALGKVLTEFWATYKYFYNLHLSFSKNVKRFYKICLIVEIRTTWPKSFSWWLISNLCLHFSWWIYPSLKKLFCGLFNIFTPLPLCEALYRSIYYNYGAEASRVSLHIDSGFLAG